MARDLAAERRTLERRFDLTCGLLLVGGLGAGSWALAAGDGAGTRVALALAGWMAATGLAGVLLRCLLERSEATRWWLFNAWEILVLGRGLTSEHKAMRALRGWSEACEKRVAALERTAAAAAHMQAEHKDMRDLVARLEQRVARAEAKVASAGDSIETAARRAAESVQKAAADAERRLRAAAAQLDQKSREIDARLLAAGARATQVDAQAAEAATRIPKAVAVQLEAQWPAIVDLIVAEAKKKDVVVTAASQTFTEFVQAVAEGFEQGRTGA